MKTPQNASSLSIASAHQSLRSMTTQRYPVKPPLQTRCIPLRCNVKQQVYDPAHPFHTPILSLIFPRHMGPLFPSHSPPLSRHLPLPKPTPRTSSQPLILMLTLHNPLQSHPRQRTSPPLHLPLQRPHPPGADFLRRSRRQRRSGLEMRRLRRRVTRGRRLHAAVLQEEREG